MKPQQNQVAPTTSSIQHAGLGRRLGAVFYDWLLLIALLLVAAVPFVVITGDTSKKFSTRSLFQIYLLAVICFYYAGFWIRSGQTLGLLTWKLKLVATDGGPITWRMAFKRLAAALLSTACVGLGFLWIAVDRDKRAWHDRLSGTRVIRVLANTSTQ